MIHLDFPPLILVIYQSIFYQGKRIEGLTLCKEMVRNIYQNFND